MNKIINITELQEVLKKDKINLIDVRSKAEYNMGHIENSINIPLNQIPYACENFREGESYYIICLSGARSARACKFLCDSKNLDVTNVVGGISNWTGKLV